MDKYRVIQYPVTTESDMKKIEEVNTWVFIVDIKANKVNICEALQAMYDVKSAEVSTLIRPDGKKKAYVRAAIVNIWVVQYNKIVLTRTRKIQGMTSNLAVVPSHCGHHHGGADVETQGPRRWNRHNMMSHKGDVEFGEFYVHRKRQQQGELFRSVDSSICVARRPMTGAVKLHRAQRSRTTAFYTSPWLF